MIKLAKAFIKENRRQSKEQFQLITSYLTKDKSKETDILFELDISRSTYYKYKKDAVKVFGYCLWQIIIPNMKRAKSTQSGQLVPVMGYVG